MVYDGIYDNWGEKMQRWFHFGIFKMAAVTMGTAKISKISKFSKLNETLQNWQLAWVDALYDFGIFKMAAARLAMGEGCHPLLLAMANLVFLIKAPKRSFWGLIVFVSFLIIMAPSTELGWHIVIVRFFLAHLARRAKWAFPITLRPASCVRRR